MVVAWDLTNLDNTFLGYIDPTDVQAKDLKGMIDWFYASLITPVSGLLTMAPGGD